MVPISDLAPPPETSALVMTRNMHPGRRRFLRGAGLSLALPLLSSGRIDRLAAADAADSKRSMVCIGNMLGFYPEAFWPTVDADSRQASGEKSPAGVQTRHDFRWGKSSAALADIQSHLSILSGLDHGLTGGHFAIHAFLSGVRQVDAKAMPLANVTIDQFAAEHVQGITRFPSLTIGSPSGIHGGCQLSWTRTGTRVPPIPGPAALFELLFVEGSAEAKAAAADRHRLQGSILDLVRDDARRLDRRLDRPDHHRLDEYLTSVREVEQRLGMRRDWIDIPKPAAPFEQPKDQGLVEDLPLLYELIALALHTDSTRIATLEIGGDFAPRDLGINGDYHALSHHGQLPDRIDALIKLDTYQIGEFRKFIQRLASLESDGQSLLDRTDVLFGSGMGNANSHTNTNLPLIVAGGSWQHNRWLDYSGDTQHRPPLTNLFVSMLQNFGIETDTFATGTGTLRGWA